MNASYRPRCGTSRPAAPSLVRLLRSHEVPLTYGWVVGAAEGGVGGVVAGVNGYGWLPRRRLWRRIHMMNTTWMHHHLGRTILVAAFSGVLALPLAVTAQERPSLQKLFEAGQYDATLQRVAEERGQGHASPESTFIAALAQHRLEQAGHPGEEYQRLAEQENPAWRMIGRSGIALDAGDLDEALATATEAVRLEEALAASTEAAKPEGAPGFAYFQLGLVQARRATYAPAAASFARAAELMPAFAYAHYYAGLSFQRVKDINLMAVHLESFLRLAPNAPERLAVVAIMRSVRR